MNWRRAKKARGASLRQRQRRRLQWSWKWPRRVAVLAVAGLACAGVYRGYLALTAIPVERVVFTGQYQHVDRNQLVARVQPLLGGGFAGADLMAMRAALEQLPWVYRASIKRRWPSDLEVAITEQQPIARWGEDGLLNHQGQVFRPQPLAAFAELPVLGGPDDQAALVMTRYREFSERLRSVELGLQGLLLEPRDGWQLALTGGVEIALGGDDVMRRMDRLLNVYRQRLAAEFDRVQRIDLRYANGMAVAWRQANGGADTPDTTLTVERRG